MSAMKQEDICYSVICNETRVNDAHKACEVRSTVDRRSSNDSKCPLSRVKIFSPRSCKSDSRKI